MGQLAFKVQKGRLIFSHAASTPPHGSALPLPFTPTPPRPHHPPPLLILLTSVGSASPCLQPLWEGSETQAGVCATAAGVAGGTASPKHLFLPHLRPSSHALQIISPVSAISICFFRCTRLALDMRFTTHGSGLPASPPLPTTCLQPTGAFVTDGGAGVSNGGIEPAAFYHSSAGTAFLLPPATAAVGGAGTYHWADTLWRIYRCYFPQPGTARTHLPPPTMLDGWLTTLRGGRCARSATCCAFKRTAPSALATNTRTHGGKRARLAPPPAPPPPGRAGRRGFCAIPCPTYQAGRQCSTSQPSGARTPSACTAPHW